VHARASFERTTEEGGTDETTFSVILDFIFFFSRGERERAKKREKSAFLLLLLLPLDFFFLLRSCGKNTKQKEREREREKEDTQQQQQIMSSKHASKQLGAKLQNLLVACGRAKRGLYHGKTVRFGNNVSEDGGNKTRRKWSPNAKRKRLYSEVLDRMVSVQVTAHALRCIDKAGGLDNYVLNTSAEKMASLKGMELKDKMMRALLEVDAAEVNDEQPPPPPPKSD